MNSAKRFVIAYVEACHKGLTNDELAAKLKISKPSLYARASKYRTMGVKLPKLPRKAGSNRIDVRDLNNIIYGLR